VQPIFEGVTFGRGTCTVVVLITCAPSTERNLVFEARHAGPRESVDTPPCLCYTATKDSDQEEYLPKRGSESRGKVRARHRRRQRMGLGVA
jgi:hypothetical protein